MDPTWMQGRASFGGVPSALALRAMRTVVAPERPARHLHTAFVGPLGPGPATVRVEVLRAGRSVTHAEARIEEEGQLRAVVLGAFGADRASQVEVAPAALPPPPEPGSIPALPFVDGGPFPSFVRYFDMRFGQGAPPWSGASRAGFGGWCRHRTAASGPEALIGLLDAWPSPVLALLSKPVPSSSVTWSAHLVPTEDVDPGGFFWFSAEPVEAAHGYSGFHSTLHTADGRLVAYGDQLVAVFG